MIEYVLHVTLIPWLAVLGGGIVAQVAPTESVGQSGFWFSLAGIIGALGMLAQKFLDDRKDARASEVAKEKDAQVHELAKKRLEIAAGQNRRVNLEQQKYLVRQHNWWIMFVSASGKELPSLPPVPALPEGYEKDDQGLFTDA